MTKKHSKRKRKGAVNTPHDAFFKQALGDPQVAQSFLQRYLPPDLLKQADLSRLKAEDRHFVREDMRQFYADALFSLPIEGKTAFVYVLIEHTAKPKKWTPLQVFQYMFRILDDYQRKNPKSQFLPLVYPLILYSGKRPYRVSTRLLDLIEGPKSIAEAVFNQPIHLIELRNEDDDQLNQHKALAAYLLSLKHAMDEIPMRQIIEILGRLPESAQSGRHFRILLQYWVGLQQKLDPADLLQWTQEVGSEAMEDTIMTLTEKWTSEWQARGHAEGHQKGLDEGRAKGRAEGREAATLEIARNLLRNQTEPRFVALTTGLDIEAVLELKAELEPESDRS